MLKAIAVAAALLSAAAAGIASPARAQDTKTQDVRALVARGEYLARLGDCVACHTAPGGQPFAGGLPIASNLGTIFSTNITPDKASGIGGYSEAQFAAAVREGVRADGSHLYPAMPYPAYGKVTDQDVHALYAYFMQGVQPVSNRVTETDLGFPFNQRWGLWFWNLAFNAPAPAKAAPADPARDDAVGRGAYLVEGLGHCGSCHTPRGIGMQETAYDGSGSDFLNGGSLNGWDVPPLRGKGTAAHGIAAWSEQDIVDYLGSGRNRFGAVGGEMKAVVEHSMAYASDADLHAIAAYLKSLPAAPAPAAKPAGAAEATAARLTAAVTLTAGERLYLDNCGACHFVTGQGARKAFPALDGASIVNAKSPFGLIRTILAGARMPSTERAPSTLPMPAFAWRLSDEEVAQLASFVRGGWSNTAPPVTAEEVAKVRKAIRDEAVKGEVAAAH